jgi:hypothetical protein
LTANERAAAGTVPDTPASTKSILTEAQAVALANLLQHFAAPAPGSELALFAELDATLDPKIWTGFIAAVAASGSARGRRILMNTLRHDDKHVVNIGLAHSDILLKDPRYSATLWRLLLAPDFAKPSRLALAYALGRHDARRVIELLPELEQVL